MKMKINPRFGMAAIGLCFLMNPLVNVIDILPDCIGWLLLACSMTPLSFINDEIHTARRLAWILFGITTVKIGPMIFSLLGQDVFEILGEPGLVLIYTLCFGAAEVYLGSRILLLWLSNVSQIGLLYDSKPAIRGADTLKIFTVWFFLVRMIGSFLPELVYLRSTEYLGNVIYGVVIDIRDYRPYLIAFCAIAVGIFGLAWLIFMLRYIRSIKKEIPDGAYGNALCSLANDKKDEIICKKNLELFAVSFGMMVAGAVFLCHFSFENLNILPDCIGVVLLFVSVFLLRKKQIADASVYRWGIAAAVYSAVYSVVRAWHGIRYHAFWTDNIVSYFRRDVVISAERQAEQMQLQLIMLALAIVETVLLLLFFYQFLRWIQKLDTLSQNDSVTVYDSIQKNAIDFEKKAYAQKPRKVWIWFCISASFEVIRALPLFTFVVTPISFVRLVINIIFVCVFVNYLASLKQILSYHYQFNDKKPDHELVR